jgi:hypothetical protein
LNGLEDDDPVEKMLFDGEEEGLKLLLGRGILVLLGAVRLIGLLLFYVLFDLSFYDSLVLLC